MPDKIALQDLSAEEEADRLLAEEEARTGPTSNFTPRSDDTEFREGLRELEEEESLPSPASHSTAAVKRMHPAPIIAIWIALSSSVILFNAVSATLRSSHLPTLVPNLAQSIATHLIWQWILGKDEGDLNFPYPITLTTFHLVYAALATRLMRKFTPLLDGLDNVEITWQRWYSNIVPIGALFSGSLIFNNLAYTTLSVPFIQMLKAFTSVAVMGLSVLMGLEQFSKRTAITVVAISFGVMIASYGEVNFVLGGFLAQCIGIAFEATRLVAIQKLLQGLRMDPLVSLYYYAPVCAAFNAILIPLFEGFEPLSKILPVVGPFTLFLNCNIALLLNISVVFLIGCASSLILTLSGVLKDILLVTGAVFLFGNVVTLTQMFGYSVALFGLFIFKTPPDVLAGYIASLRSLVGSR